MTLSSNPMRLLATAVGIFVAATACSSSSHAAKGVLGKNVKPVAISLPTSLLGLTIAPEDVSKAIGAAGAGYVDQTSEYSFRRKDVLEATLQVIHFIPDAKYRTSKFRRSLIAGIGGTIAKDVRLGPDTVALTSGNQQRISVWFRGPYLFILATRNDFDQPRTLLRQVLALPLGSG